MTGATAGGVSSGGLHIAWARLFVRALAASGVRRAVVSPGSRSTPLVLAVAEEETIEAEVVIDERSAAFFALGQARASGEPTLLLCTSGTAGAHYLPAIIEASESGAPLVVVTADRPWEAYDTRAAQTVDQVKWYGDHVRHYAELGLPDPSPAALRAVMRIAAQAVERACGGSPGPVHVNARFRPPLEPAPRGAPERWEPLAREALAAGPPRVLRSVPSPSEEGARLLSELASRARAGVVVCGPAPASAASGDARRAVATFVERSGFALLAEATSQMRFGVEAQLSFGSFDAALRDPAVRRAVSPDVIVEIGRPAVSRAYASWLSELRDARRVVLDPHGWGDPSGGASAMVFADPYATLARAGALLDRRAPPAELVAAIAAAEARITDHVATDLRGPLGEGAVARAAFDALPAGGVLVVGNSTPVRDLDTYVPPCAKPVTVAHQRGASGIDGLLAGAAGTRSVVDAPVVALVGDVSFAHDVGSLPLLARARAPLAVVVVNNGGGRIFDQLPIGSLPEMSEHFERFFATPPSIDVVATARAFGIEAVRVEAAADLASALSRSVARDGATIIEALVPPREGARRRASIWR